MLVLDLVVFNVLLGVECWAERQIHQAAAQRVKFPNVVIDA